MANALWLTAQPLMAQLPPPSRRPNRGIQVIPLRDLRFGTVISGVITRVDPEQQRQSGLFGITGEQDMSVRIDLLLPTALANTAGDQFPILFSGEDGTASANRGRGQNLPFDPHQPLVTTLGRNGRLYIRLGGSVAPSLLQAGGSYTATITLIVANLGS